MGREIGQFLSLVRVSPVSGDPLPHFGDRSEGAHHIDESSNKLTGKPVNKGGGLLESTRGLAQSAGRFIKAVQ